MSEEKKEEIEITIRISDKEILTSFFLILDAGVKTHGIRVVDCASEINKQIRNQVAQPENKNGAD